MSPGQCYTCSYACDYLVPDTLLLALFPMPKKGPGNEAKLLHDHSFLALCTLRSIQDSWVDQLHRCMIGIHNVYPPEEKNLILFQTYAANSE